jgi:hypothetical protein
MAIKSITIEINATYDDNDISRLEKLVDKIVDKLYDKKWLGNISIKMTMNSDYLQMDGDD